MCGFSPLCIFPSILEYETPSFEKKSLHALGVDLEQNWRYGDMIILRSTSYLRPLIFGDYIFEESVWKDIAFQKKRIKIKINPMIKNYIKPEIIPIYNKSSIFPTVSRRHPSRKFVDMWTSDNEVFVLVGHNIIYDVLIQIKNDGDIEQILKYISQKYVKNTEEIQQDVRNIYEMLKTILGGV